MTPLEEARRERTLARLALAKAQSELARARTKLIQGQTLQSQQHARQTIKHGTAKVARARARASAAGANYAKEREARLPTEAQRARADFIHRSLRVAAHLPGLLSGKTPISSLLGIAHALTPRVPGEATAPGRAGQGDLAGAVRSLKASVDQLRQAIARWKPAADKAREVAHSRKTAPAPGRRLAAEGLAGVPLAADRRGPREPQADIPLVDPSFPKRKQPPLSADIPEGRRGPQMPRRYAESARKAMERLSGGKVSRGRMAAMAAQSRTIAGPESWAEQATRGGQGDKAVGETNKLLKEVLGELKRQNKATPAGGTPAPHGTTARAGGKRQGGAGGRGYGAAAMEVAAGIVGEVMGGPLAAQAAMAGARMLTRPR